ncbi:ribosome biogenesis protein Noc4 [Heliocybe sulcata]|uniref:Ribosome biogenesis protein Noc4 n=1 Tax=Heliocybe sulcata TaxID=5364 RepID=A0A5C3MQX3_9AGAM|nr:ribosome biogenesis protein Noc4 [Heliocybe sulcata]
MHSLPPAKRRKLSPPPTKPSPSLKQIAELESNLTTAISSSGSLNTLDDLVTVTQRSRDALVVSKGIYSLYRVFVMIVDKGMLNTKGEEGRVVRGWIWERLSGYGEYLVGLMTDDEKALRTSALQILFSLLKHLSSASTLSEKANNAKAQPQFHNAYFKRIVRGLLLCPVSPRLRNKAEGEGGRQLDADVRDQFLDTWLSVYDDIRWFFLRETSNLMMSLNQNEKPVAVESLVSLLERLTTFPTDASELNAWWVEELGSKPPKPGKGATEDDEDPSSGVPDDAEDDWRKFFDEEREANDPTTKTKSKKTGPAARLHTLTIHQSLHSLPAHRAVFTRAWLFVLQQLSALDADSRRRVSVRILNVMHQGVLPHLTRPVLVMDWVASCVDYGGAVGLLGLNTLFVLMREYNLDYPAFYTRLYAFLDRDILHLKHRARFFRMAELFLSSTHLPATILASFVKKLARLSLNAPPAAIITLVPFTYNILKRHPTLMGMIHRIADADEDMGGCLRFLCPVPHDLSDVFLCADPFDVNEPNPTLTNALSSSLWELYTHRNHYHPAVSTLVRIFEEAFTKPSYGLEDFLDHTYATLFENETKGQVRKEPVVEEDELGMVAFPVAGMDANDRREGDVISELWCF